MMVKYISFMIILGVSLLFTSCVYHFDLDEAEGIPKLVVYSYPGSGDTTVVRFSRSLPVTGKGEIVSGLTGTDVRLEVNGHLSVCCGRTKLYRVFPPKVIIRCRDTRKAIVSG